MKLRRQHAFRAEVATSSLNDIMFFLLLFFFDHLHSNESQCDQSPFAKIKIRPNPEQAEYFAYRNAKQTVLHQPA